MGAVVGRWMERFGPEVGRGHGVSGLTVLGDRRQPAHMGRGRAEWEEDRAWRRSREGRRWERIWGGQSRGAPAACGAGSSAARRRRTLRGRDCGRQRRPLVFFFYSGRGIHSGQSVGGSRRWNRCAFPVGRACVRAGAIAGAGAVGGVKSVGAVLEVPSHRSDLAWAVGECPHPAGKSNKWF
jgi:hypothetical protein